MGELLVGVMAGDAGEPRIPVAPAPAVFKTIGLEAYIGNADGTHFIDVVQSTMASAAEIHESNGAQAFRIEDGLAALFKFLGVHEFDMSGARAMTRLTSYSWEKMRRIESSGCDGARGVAAEAAAQSIGVQ